ncbi:MAG TPA: hypothetical protein VI874_05340 [Candidatus Norongarragalinales archaeon]|nr:hypothetical protein [Candidatus Norongarragalinales archaeon]
MSRFFEVKTLTIISACFPGLRLSFRKKVFPLQFFRQKWETLDIIQNDLLQRKAMETLIEFARGTGRF